MKIGFVSLGCPKNLVDSEVMLGMAEKDGHEITSDASQADVLVVNTCAFIDRAKQESIDTILEMAELKKQVAGRRLVVTGCMAERYRDELKKEIPEIDAIYGTGEVEGLSQFMSGAPASRAPGAAIPMTLHRKPVFGVDLPTYIYDADTPRKRVTPGHYAYVKIAEGCDYKCAFCIIPKMRGHYRSRPIDSIVKEAHALAAQGVKELLLISQDSTFYGIDRGERGALPKLLRALNDVDGIEWIRLLYLYPTTINDEVIDAIADLDKVVKYIDLPLQHASDAVLKRMKRPGTRQLVRPPARQHPRAHSQRRAPHHLHRRLPRRDRRGLRRARRLHHRDRLRPRRRLHLLARGRHLRARADRRRAGGDEEEAPGPADGAAEENRRGAAEAPARRDRPASWSMASRPSMSWCWSADCPARRPRSTRSST